MGLEQAIATTPEASGNQRSSAKRKKAEMRVRGIV
jgi:hypothetical protein